MSKYKTQRIAQEVIFRDNTSMLFDTVGDITKYFQTNSDANVLKIRLAIKLREVYKFSENVGGTLVECYVYTEENEDSEKYYNVYMYINSMQVESVRNTKDYKRVVSALMEYWYENL